MTLNKEEFKKLKKSCNKLDDGPDYRIDDYVTNMLNTVLDFQMDVKTVSSAINHYEKHYGYRTHKKLKKIIEEFQNTKSGNLKLANSLWGNNHWSRAKFLRKLLKNLEKRGVNGQKSLKKWVSEADFERDVKGQFKTNEHSIGIALFQWLSLRVGIDTVKPDVHIMNYIAAQIGRKASQKEAIESLIKVAKKTNRKPALLDAAIWHYQKENS